MGWSIGYDSKWQRDIGYGVPAVCDHPGCNEKIDRGLSYVCCNAEPFGGEGCGLYFCFAHSNANGQCQCCDEGGLETFTPKPDVPEWINHKLTDESWAQWRSENPEWVADNSKDKD